MTDVPDRRAQGSRMMQEVYGFTVPPEHVQGAFLQMTVDHLFGEVWTRPQLSVADRRLLTIGVLAAAGQPQLLEIQFRSALDNGEMTEEQVRECVVHLAHYVGWPLATRVNEAVEAVLARRQKDGVSGAFDFAGKVAVVTGAGRGIGRVYALALAAAGAAVVVADLDEAGAAAVADEITRSGGDALGVAVDVADPASAAAMAAAAAARFGGIDLLVNNAAIFGGMQIDLLLTVDWEYLQRFLAVNQLGALVCVRACYEQMAARGGGAIVNQSSTAAYMYAGFYGWAKAGVNSLTQQLAHELGGMGIRVNAIAPGPIDTEAARAVVPEAIIKQLVRSLALKRQGTPEDLVGMCLFLLSDHAAWVTGHVFNVDGGQVVRP